jgi:type II secretory pathway pseudopilin PulG
MSHRLDKSLIPIIFYGSPRTARALQSDRRRAELMQIRKAEGFALIDLIFVCGVIGLLCSIALPRFVLAKQSAGASSAIGSMRAVSSAQLTYALTCGSGFYAPNLSTLGTPPPGSNEAFIGGGLGAADSVVKSSYVIQVAATSFAGAPAACNGLAAGQAGQGYVAAADPSDTTFPRFFGTNANNVIYEHTSSLFGLMPETGAPPVGAMLMH